MKFDEQMRAYTQAVAARLDDCFTDDTQPQRALFEAMRYSLLAGGKRIRPALTLAFCDLCGGDTNSALDFAIAVEMVHTYSLIHDDLPCMDNDDLRRGKPTNHRVYGEATAIMAGDALLTAAFGTLASANLSSAQIVRAVRALSLCAGELGMVGGQILDMHAETRECTAQDVHDIQLRKTGALISAACQLGVIAADGDEGRQAAASRFADAFGLAFQIEDDILDVIGDAQKLGKATGMDGKKNTFVRLYGIARCREMVKEEVQKALDALAYFGGSSFLSQLVSSLAVREF
ncbi:MAG: polyprenyl synthetase family protein [Oscillospiraceae bacterium]|jgi:geranylgeranyl diphosphate synthase type II|nr:polyprenyl synthetase family protein [Oscillospiraceae bacterium]